MSRSEQEATLETVKQLLSVRPSIYSDPLYYKACMSKEQDVTDTLVNKITQPVSKNSVCSSNERKIIETNYDTFIKSVDIVHNDLIDNVNDALGLLVEKEKSTPKFRKKH